MCVEECISAEELAQLFHRYHGVLTGCFDGRTATAPWDQVDPHQRRLLIATARLVLSDLAAKQQAGESQEADSHEADDRQSPASETISRKNGNHVADRRYYARPSRMGLLTRTRVGTAAPGRPCRAQPGGKKLE